MNKTAKDNSVTFPTWKIVQLGTGLRTGMYFDAALHENNCLVEWWGDDLMRRVYISKQPLSVSLARITCKQLGLENEYVARELVYEKAIAAGLKPCPGEVGPQLRLQYLDQPVGETIYVGMEPVISSNDYPGIFVVQRGSAPKGMSPLDSMCSEAVVSTSGARNILDGTYGM